jgi:hypothetical protein
MVCRCILPRACAAHSIILSLVQMFSSPNVAERLCRFIELLSEGAIVQLVGPKIRATAIAVIGLVCNLLQAGFQVSCCA